MLTIRITGKPTAKGWAQVGHTWVRENLYCPNLHSTPRGDRFKYISARLHEHIVGFVVAIPDPLCLIIMAGIHRNREFSATVGISNYLAACSRNHDVGGTHEV